MTDSKEDFSFYFDKILNFLSYRARSEYEINYYMLRKSWPEEIKKAVIESLIKISPWFEIRVYNRLATAIECYNPDLIITHSAWIPPQTISRLKKNTNAIIVSWFPDHPGNIGRQYLFAAPYDFLFFKDFKQALRKC